MTWTGCVTHRQQAACTCVVDGQDVTWMHALCAPTLLQVLRCARTAWVASSSKALDEEQARASQPGATCCASDGVLLVQCVGACGGMLMHLLTVWVEAGRILQDKIKTREEERGREIGRERWQGATAKPPP